MNESYPFSEYLRILGKGPKARRNLAEAEASRAFEMLCNGQVTDRQLGAFLLLMRANGESQDELNGFLKQAKLCMNDLSGTETPDLDWGTYSGKWRYPPYFLLSLKILAYNGYKILLHGDHGQFETRAYAQQWLKDLHFHEIEVAHLSSWKESQVNYLALHKFAPLLRDILHLKEELGVRTVFNTLVKLLNPYHAPVSIQGIYHKGVERLHHSAASKINQQYNLVFKGEGGEAEIRPDALTTLYFSLPNDQSLAEIKVPAVIERQKRPEVWHHKNLIDLWKGSSSDLYGEQSVICTTAVALMSIKLSKIKEPEQAKNLIYSADFFSDSYQQASSMWAQRGSSYVKAS